MQSLASKPDDTPFIEQRLSKTPNPTSAPMHRAYYSFKIPGSSFAELATENYSPDGNDAFGPADVPFIGILQSLDGRYRGPTTEVSAPLDSASLERTSIKMLLSVIMDNQDEIHKPITALTKAAITEAAQKNVPHTGKNDWLRNPGPLLHDADSSYVLSGFADEGPFRYSYEEPGWHSYKSPSKIASDLFGFIRHLDRDNSAMLDFPDPGMTAPVVASLLPPKLLWKLFCASVAARQKLVVLKLWRRMAHIPTDETASTCRFAWTLSVDELVEHFGITTKDFELLEDLESVIGFLALRLRLPGAVEFLLRIALQATAFRHSKVRTHASCEPVKNVLSTVVMIAFYGLYSGTWYMHDGVSPVVGKKEDESRRVDKLSRFRRWHRMCELALEIVGEDLPTQFINYSQSPNNGLWNPLSLHTHVVKPSSTDNRCSAVTTLRIAISASGVTQWPFRAIMSLPARWFREIDLLDACFLLASCKNYSEYVHTTNPVEFQEPILSSASREDMIVLAYAKLVELACGAGTEIQRRSAYKNVHKLWCILPYEVLSRTRANFNDGLSMPDLQTYFSGQAPPALNHSGNNKEYEGDVTHRVLRTNNAEILNLRKRQKLNGVNPDTSPNYPAVFWHQYYPYYWNADVDYDPSGPLSKTVVRSVAQSACRQRNFNPAHEGAYGSQATFQRLVFRLLGEMPNAPEGKDDASVALCVTGMSMSIYYMVKSMPTLNFKTSRTAANRHFVAHLKNAIEVYLDTIRQIAAQDECYLRNATDLMHVNVHSAFMTDHLSTLTTKYLDLVEKIASHVFCIDKCPIACGFAEYWSFALKPCEEYSVHDANALYLGEAHRLPDCFAGTAEAIAALEPTRRMHRSMLFYRTLQPVASIGSECEDAPPFNTDVILWIRDFMERYADSENYGTDAFNFREAAFEERSKWFEQHKGWKTASFRCILNDTTHPLTRFLMSRDVARNGCGILAPSVPQTKQMLAAFDAETEEVFRAMLRICKEPVQLLHWTLAVAAAMRWDIGARVLLGPFETRSQGDFTRGIVPNAIPEWMLSYLEYDISIGERNEEGALDRVRTGIVRPYTVVSMSAYLQDICADIWAPGGAAASTLAGF